jgi:hypothetical protein
MEKHFVTYDQALALKELGFDESCLSEFWKRDDGELFPISGNELFELKYQKERTSNVDDMTFVINRPLKSQVFEWFRDKHNLYHEIRTFAWDYDKKELGFSIRTYLNPIDIETERLIHSEVYETYKEAESACIDKLIEIVKSKKQ